MDAAVLNLMICWLLAGVFVLAVKHKLSAWVRFKASLGAYRLVPQPLVGAAAALIVAAELVAIFALLLWQPLGLYVAIALLSLYAAAIAINVARGRTQIDCGCGDEPTPVSMTLVFRNLFLIALGAYSLSEPTADVTWVTGVIAAGLALVGFALYIAIEQLIANRARHRRLWLGVT